MNRAPLFAGPCTGRYYGERLVIFDPETLLLDPTRGIQHALRCTLRDLGQPLPDDAFRHWSLRTPVREALAILLDSRDPARLDRGCEHYHRHYDEAGRFRCTLLPGTAALLASLACDPRFELHYLTHAGATAAAQLLDVYGLQHFVRSIVTTELPCCPGVRPALIKQLVAGSGRPPASWVLLSDHPWELLAAQDLHLRSIALGYGRAPLPTLRQIEADAIAADLPDVEARLRDLVGVREPHWFSNAAAYCH